MTKHAASVHSAHVEALPPSSLTSAVRMSPTTTTTVCSDECCHCLPQGGVPTTTTTTTTRCIFTTYVTLISITGVLLQMTMRHPLYVVSGLLLLRTGRQKGTVVEEENEGSGGVLHVQDLYVYSSGSMCYEEARCLSSPSSLQHCRDFPFVNNCAEGHLLSLQSVRLTMDLTLMCLSLFVILFIGGSNVFNLIPHTNAAVSRRLLAAASAFLFTNAILSIMLLHAGHCGQTPDKVATLRNIGDSYGGAPIATHLSVAPFCSLLAGVTVAFSTLFLDNIENIITTQNMSLIAQRTLMCVEFVVIAACALLSFATCDYTSF